MAVAAAALVLAGCTGPAPGAQPAPGATPPTPAPGTAGAPAPPVPRAGTPGWEITRSGPGRTEGFADRVSVLPGEPVTLYVSSTAPRFTVTAYRMGYYLASRALRVWSSAPVPAAAQPPAQVVGPTATVVAPWQPSLRVATSGWTPGMYLLRLDGADGSASYVPLTVRTPSNAGRVVLLNAVTTWQAYNRWGGRSLYAGPAGYADRSRAVSFDRPYATGAGAADFLGLELPLLVLAERSGVPLGYATDTDLDARPDLLAGARGLVTLGHDEYWSAAMRANATAARDAGTNLAFLGANSVYRHIRLGPTALGPDRWETDYKSFAEDPLSRTDPPQATADWRSPPYPRPESVLVGVFYQCNPVSADLVVADPQNWLLAGIVRPGQRLPGAVGTEYDKVDLAVPTPRPIEVLFRSPVTCRGKRDVAEGAYYTTPSGAGVFATGTINWICALDGVCAGRPIPAEAGRVVGAITTRLLQAFAEGPVGRAHPAVDNLTALGDPTPRPHPGARSPRPGGGAPGTATASPGR